MSNTETTTNGKSKDHDGIIQGTIAGAQKLMSGMGERLAPVGGAIRNAAKSSPLLTLAGAIGIGFLLGSLLRRGRA